METSDAAVTPKAGVKLYLFSLFFATFFAIALPFFLLHPADLIKLAVSLIFLKNRSG